MTFPFVKFCCSIGIFFNTAHLICRSTDISKCFRGSLRLRDNESRLYIRKVKTLSEKICDAGHVNDCICGKKVRSVFVFLTYMSAHNNHKLSKV